MLSTSIKDSARALGFDLVGIASANDPMLEDAVKRYRGWVDDGRGATMDYLRKHADLKAHPEKLLPGWKSVICVALLYGESAPASRVERAPTARSLANDTRAEVSLYTRGADYHRVMGEKLDALAQAIGREPGATTRAFVDSEPVLDRFWAWRAGLGWLGKNTCLIDRKLGSYLFLGGILTSLEFELDAPQPDHCGRCRKCIDACPTDAISEERFVDSGLCIGYHTIENRGPIPEEIMSNMGRWVAGCDICQQVCPWNDPVTEGKSFASMNPAYNAELTTLVRWSAEDFKQNTRDVAMGRMKYAGFLRNVVIAVANSGLDARAKTEALAALAAQASQLPDNLGRTAALSALSWAKPRA